MTDVSAKKVRFVTIDEAFEDQRLDNFLLRELKGVPRSYVYKIVRKGEVRVNKGRTSVKYRLKSGDIVRIPPLRMSAQISADHRQKPIPLLKNKLEKAILYEDRDLIVLNKPTGMAVHGGSGISFGVIETLRAMRPEEKHLELAHRLDRETSGCLVVTRRRAALKVFHELLQQDKIEKKYLALVYGHWGKKTSISIDAPLKKNMLKGGERMVQVDPTGKQALTHFKLLEKFADAMLLEATLVTGRTHQIRVHLAHAGTPIIGDPKYGNDYANRQYRKLGLNRLFLHAYKLSFSMPGAAQQMNFQAPLDEELEAILAVLRA